MSKSELNVTSGNDNYNVNKTYLGDTLYRSLTDRPHIENLAHKVKTRMNLVRKLATVKDTENNNPSTYLLRR